MMLTVYGRATSSNVQLVMWTLAELGLDCERLDYGHAHGGLDTPEFGSMNPHRKVPVLRDGDLVVWESTAILRYLASRYGDGGAFWPADPALRAPVDMWAEWAKSTLVAGFTHPIFWPRVRTPAADRDEARLAAAITAFDGHLARLADQLDAQPYICGDHFTAADIVAGHLLFRWFTIDVPRAANPTVEAYYNRLTQRPAYQTHVMVPYDALRVEGA
ncbi:glutathione S-transferase family protein [Roseovarius sp. SK2]|jgi:glutathione S-transferase|uniref:glutathione S-transferase family protein n=2 Tax=Roseovarius TaxID=74030 RepID=UPI001FE94738|nr:MULTISPECIES: glutathione S-transferase family protein [Roseovarius]MDD9726222.1 glutathione S-transferase family protein [Roseovarius sp. SK2]